MSPSLPPELLNLKSLCLSSYEDQDNFTRIKEWVEKKDNQVIFCCLCKEKDDFNRFWNAIQNGGKNGNFWSSVMMNEVLKKIKDIWQTPFSDFLVKYAHRNPKWDFASHYLYWEALLQSQDFFTLTVFNHPDNYARTTKKESIHLLRNAQIKRLERIQSGFDNWITPTHPYAFDWLFSKVLGQDIDGALELIEKGFKWFPLNESETHEKVRRYYGYLHDQAHLDFQKESDMQRDKVLTQQWQLLLDIGLPSLSQTQNHPKSSPGVALLEFERGGMRERAQMVSWLRFSTRPWPYAQNEESALDWAAHHGIDLNKISASILNDCWCLGIQEK